MFADSITTVRFNSPHYPQQILEGETHHAESFADLGRDPEVRYSRQGTAVTQFSVATSERWKDKESGELQQHTEWFAVKTFGRRAEVAGEYLHKGSRIYIEGRKRTESWDDKQTGGKHYRDLVYVDKMEFLDSRGNGDGPRDMADNEGHEPAIAGQDIPF